MKEIKYSQKAGECMLNSSFIKTDKQKQLAAKAEKLAETFSERAEYYDRHALFPFENFDDLKKPVF